MQPRFFPTRTHVFVVDSKWDLRNRLLAVRQFDPDTEKLDSTRLSAVIDDYLINLLNLFSAMSDSSGDMRVYASSLFLVRESGAPLI